MNLKKNTLLAGIIALALPLFAGCASHPAAQPAAAAQTQPAANVTASDNVLPAADDAARVLPLQGALNARNFAGLQGGQGAIPATSFVRTADLSRITAADRDQLASDGVVLDLDLRTADEEHGSHDVLADDSRFKYVRISLLGSEKLEMESLPDSLGQMYVQSLAANQLQFRQVFQTIAAQKDGTVLFHCTAGKDRTGMVAALLLSLAGVPREQVVHDYAISAHYLKPMMASYASNPQMAEMVKRNPKIMAMMGTAPREIEAFLDTLDAQYGGAHGYLKAIGVSDDEVQNLLARLGQ